MAYVREHWMEVFEVTEMKEGAIYKTRSLGYCWIRESLNGDLPYPSHPVGTGSLIYAACSTKEAERMNFLTSRSVLVS